MRQSSRLFEMDMVNTLLLPLPPGLLFPCLASSSGNISAPKTEYTMTRTTRPGVENIARIVKLHQRLRVTATDPTGPVTVSTSKTPISCSICSESDMSHASQFPKCHWTLISCHRIAHYDVVCQLIPSFTLAASAVLGILNPRRVWSRFPRATDGNTEKIMRSKVLIKSK